MKKIGLCKQSGKNTVTAYDEKGSVLWVKTGILVGYTSDTVSIKSGVIISVYDSRGGCKFRK